MAPQSQFPKRLASEEVIINAPLSYAGSAQRIVRIRRRAPAGWQLGALTLLAIVLIALVWVFLTAWYLTWGLFLVPYRLLRRGARKRKADALRHRELLGTIQGSAAASAGAFVAANTAIYARAGSDPPAAFSPSELVADADRERIIDELREHMLLGRLPRRSSRRASVRRTEPAHAQTLARSEPSPVVSERWSSVRRLTAPRSGPLRAVSCVAPATAPAAR